MNRFTKAWNRDTLSCDWKHDEAGAIKEIPGEVKRRGYGKALVCSDPDLVSFSVTAKATDELDA
ncbi:MAG: hypothetical protein UC368_08710 [Eggerthellaceae bacterium]|nr:hypothetical protein [Eggerthellaceae bacterium]